MDKQVALKVIADQAVSCVACELHKGRIKSVFSRGNPDSKIVFVGEAPGADENEQGLPFVGRAGKLLDAMIGAMGFNRDDVYVCNICKCLRYNAKVQLSDGSFEAVSSLVKRKYNGLVKSVNDKNEIINQRVIGWYKSPTAGREIFKLTFDSAKYSSNGRSSVQLTGDHLVLTQNGWKRADSLTSEKIATGLSINRNVHDVIIGTLLGDGHIPSTTAYLTFNHSIKQHSYCLEKLDYLKSYGAFAKLLDVKNKNGKIYKTIRGATISNRIFHYYRNMFYNNGKKHVPEGIELSPLSLAIWFMDDGYTKHKYNGSSLSEIAVHSFSEDDNNRLIKAISKFGIKAYLNKSKNRILFDIQNTKLLSELICEYCLPEMQYKLTPNTRNKYKNISSKDFSLEEVIYDNVIIEKVNAKIEKSVYCIDVENTHNFVTSGGVVHNCRPPDNRKPKPEEMLSCKHFLVRQLDIVEPKVIIALGATAVEGLLGPGPGITKRRGLWGLYNGVKVMPTFHPAYLLRNPSAKDIVKTDLQEVLKFLKEEDNQAGL